MIKRLATIRKITTGVATILVAMALVIVAVGLITALPRAMVDEEAEAARAQASEVVGQIEAGRPPVLASTPEFFGQSERAWTFSTEQPALKCVYLAVMSLDPTGTARKR